MADAIAPVEAVPCECTEHRCVPVPVQHVRYRVRIGPDPQGVVQLCAHCYVNAHMADYEYRYKAEEMRKRWDSKAS